jgi:hypothetical protein
LKDFPGLADSIKKTPIPTDKWWPLCWPTDVTYAQMADLLFFKPHNSTTLHDTTYPFTDEQRVDEMRRKWPGRPLPTKAKVQALGAAYQAYLADLRSVNQDYFPPAGQDAPPQLRGVAQDFGFPRLVPPPGADVAESKRTDCIGAGIQY